MDESGSLTSHEGVRPAHESISVKDVICKVDVNRDGVLAAASARKLDKGGYSLQEHAAVALCSQDPGLLDVDKALAELLCEGGSVFAASSKSHEMAQVEAWIAKFFRGGVADVLEVSWGTPVVSEAARLRGHRVPPCFTHLALSYGIAWDLEQDSHLQAISSAIELFSPRALVVNLRQKEIPEALLRLTLHSAASGSGRFHVAAHLSGQEGLWEPRRLDAWRAEFGTLADPHFPWSFVRADSCQFLRANGRGTPIIEGSMIWLSDLELSKVGLRCSKPDALGCCAHPHSKGKVKGYNLLGAAFCISLEDSSLRGAVEYSVAPVNTYSSTEAGTPSAPAVRAAPAPALVMPLPDVRSGEDLSPEERTKLEREVDQYSKKMDVYWKSRADARDWDSVRADLEVYALAGEKVTEDFRRIEAYRDLVCDGLKIAPGPTRPGLTEADVAAIKEVVRRKAAGFWVEGTTRTTVRKFAHDCIPTGPPVSSQPHSLRGEAAQWVEEECQRGQLVRGSSAWGSAPFPTKEMPSHKVFRKRRLVVDYRRVNARVKRSTYYCRRGTDVLAAAVGSVWYTFVDAVSGFNQIRNTKRAREVLAIVARSGKYLPVGLTFGPVNGPDDFNFVVDRAYAPGRGSRLRFTKEWIAYVDDLTVRSGRVIDGTHSEAEQAIRDACSKGSVAAPQSAGAALGALGVRQQGAADKRAGRDSAKVDTNHPTRFSVRRPERLGPPRVPSTQSL